MSAIMQTASGRGFDLLCPRADQVEWRVIANALSRICRFGGHLPEDVENYSVAQHSCHVADILPPDLRLAGLLHDAHEAFTGDLISPYRNALYIETGRSATGVPAHLQIDQRIQVEILTAAGIQPPGRIREPEIRNADLTVLSTERRALLADSAIEWPHLPAPLPARITPWNRIRAADEFLARLDRWLPLFKPHPLLREGRS